MRKNLKQFFNEVKDINYNEDLKAEFKKLGRKFCNEVVSILEASDVAKNCKVSFNPAGIAVSGDHCIVGDFIGKEKSFYVSFGCSQLTGNNIMYRLTKNQKDFSGETNHYAPNTVSPADLAEKIKAILR